MLHTWRNWFCASKPSRSRQHLRRLIHKLFPSQKKPCRKATFTPAFETLEERQLMSVFSVMSGVLVGPTGGFAGAFAPPQPTAAGLALINSLPDTPVRAAALSDYQRDGCISRNDMMDIFYNGSGGYANLTASEIGSLGTLVGNGPTLAMPDYVQNLAWKCFDGIGAGGEAGAQILGANVSNFFLGQVHPNMGGNTAYYQVNAPLWNGQPAYGDVTGDSALPATLAEVAYRRPGDIMKMFIDNGDSTYTVRFYKNGAPDFVTVDSYLPFYKDTADPVLASAKTCLWVALGQKAYIQEQEPDGDPASVLSAIEGPVGSSSPFGPVSSSGDINAFAIASAWSQGSFVLLHVKEPPSSLSEAVLWSPYEYDALVGVDTSHGDFIFADGPGWLYEVAYGDLPSVFDSWLQAAAVPPPAQERSITGFAYSATPAVAGQDQPPAMLLRTLEGKLHLWRFYEGTSHTPDLNGHQNFRWVVSVQTDHGRVDLSFGAGDLLQQARRLNGHQVVVTGTRPFLITLDSISGHDAQGHPVSIGPGSFIAITSMEARV
jgi:hypothetical protein